MTERFEKIPISQIHVGIRRREKIKTKDLNQMKASIGNPSIGLIHPISIRPNGKGYELVSGETRLRAVQALGWKRITARVGNFTQEQLREIELDENRIRTALTPDEASAAKMRRIEKAEHEADQKEISAQVGQKSRGRPKGGDSEIARRTGLSRGDVQRTKKHVAAFNAYPFLRGGEWSRDDAMNAAKKLDSIPAKERKQVVAIAEEPGCPVKEAKKIIANAAQMKVDALRDTLNLYQSEDDETHHLATSRLTRIPPVPPSRLLWAREAIKSVEKIAADPKAKGKRECASALKTLNTILKMNQDAYQKLKKQEGF